MMKVSPRHRVLHYLCILGPLGVEGGSIILEAKNMLALSIKATGRLERLHVQDTSPDVG
jgi:hypothetical protein